MFACGRPHCQIFRLRRGTFSNFLPAAGHFLKVFSCGGPPSQCSSFSHAAGHFLKFFATPQFKIKEKHNFFLEIPAKSQGKTTQKFSGNHVLLFMSISYFFS